MTVRQIVGRSSRASAAALVLALSGVAVSTYATAPAASVTPARLLRAAEVGWAERHWADTAWNDATPVAAGADQPDYECAEFVARALAAAGLVPGLHADDPQDAYYHYTAPSGIGYDLLLISDVPPYRTLYDYLMDSRLGTDVGDRPAQARPGDVVVSYAGEGGAKSHTGLVVTGAGRTTEPALDAHNRARSHLGYHYFEPAHLLRIEPLALVYGPASPAPQSTAGSAPVSPVRPTPVGTTPVGPTMVGPTAQPTAGPPPSDPAGPQV
jgi:hypothetical protein